MLKCLRCVSVAALVLCLVHVSARGEEKLPKPLLELQFDDGFANTGTVGGAATPTVYAEGEELYLMPGPWRESLDATSASRFGGTLGQQTPAGSAVVFSNAAIDSLQDFTVTFWMRAAKDTRDISSRLLTKSGAWEVLYGNGRPVFLAVKGQDKFPYRLRAPAAERVREWTFIAVSVDAAHGEIHLYSGGMDSELVGPDTFDLTQPPSQTDGQLQIGNFQGIRPFKGWMDNIRIYGVALTQEQVRQLFTEDMKGQSNGGTIYNCGYPSIQNKRFRPKHSDVFFSSRWQKRKQEEAFAMMRDFHVTHLLWVYGSSPDYIREVHDMGIFYQGALNGLCGCERTSPEREAQGDTTGRQWNLDGNKVLLPHMVKWSVKHPRWTGCQNNPAFREIFWENAAQLVEAGVDSIHVDDWEMSLGTASHGLACFCPACIAGFRTYLKEKLSEAEIHELGIEDIRTFDYCAFLKATCGIENAEQYRAQFKTVPLTPHFIDFQRAGLRDFYSELHKHLAALSPEKYIPVTVNNHFRGRAVDDIFRGSYCVDLLDFFVGEASIGMQNANDYVQPCKTAEAFGIAQIMMTKPRWLGASQAALATTCALGQWFRVPWDLYMGNDPTGQPAPRYYGTREEWLPLYGFAYDNAHLFDGYSSAATVAVLFNADDAPYAPVRAICQRLMELQVPFRLIAGAAKFNRIPLSGDALSSVRFIIELSPIENYCEEDRATIAAVRNSHRTRFLTPDDDMESLLEDYGRIPVRVEGPRNIYAFLRVKPEPEPAAAIHVVNWNLIADGSGPDAFHHVTVSLTHPERWGKSPQAKYYRPGQEGGVVLEPEAHRDFIRITLPRLETWGIIEIKSQRE